MLEKILDIIIPHHCLNCSKIGSILCNRCKNYILDQAKTSQKLTSNYNYRHYYCFGDKSNPVKQIIYQYKLSAIKELAPILADFYLALLPINQNLTIIPLPSTNKHINQRGFDHILLIAQALSHKTNWPIITDCYNLAARSQKDLTAKARALNVKNSFIIKTKLDPNQNYLVIDDFITTGATVREFVKALKKAGARQVDLAVLIKN